MVENETLNIITARENIKDLERQIEKYLNDRHIAFIRTQPSAYFYKEIIVDVAPFVDKFTSYVVRDSFIDEELKRLIDSLIYYQTYIIKEMKEKNIIDLEKLEILELRAKGYKWREIAQKMNYSVNTVQRKVGFKS